MWVVRHEVVVGEVHLMNPHNFVMNFSHWLPITMTNCFHNRSVLRIQRWTIVELNHNHLTRLRLGPKLRFKFKLKSGWSQIEPLTLAFPWIHVALKVFNATQSPANFANFFITFVCSPTAPLLLITFITSSVEIILQDNIVNATITSSPSILRTILDLLTRHRIHSR